MDKIAFLMYWGDEREVPLKQDRVVIANSSAEKRIEKEYSISWNLMGKIRFDDSRRLEIISDDLAAKVGDDVQTRVNGARDCYVQIPRYQREIIGSVFVQYFLQK